MTQREAFEKWQLSIGGLASDGLFFRSDGVYHYNKVQCDWFAWQSACEYQKSKDAEICEKIIPEFNMLMEREAVMHCADSIRNQEDK